MISNSEPILLLIAFLSLDNTHILQGNFSKPLIACSIVGAVLGDFRLGLLVGVTFQVLWLAILPVGGTYFPEGGISAMYFLFLVKQLVNDGYNLDFIFFPAVLLAILFAIGGGGISILFRKINAKIIIIHEHRNSFWPSWAYILWGILTHFILWFIILFLFEMPLLLLIKFLSGFEIFILPVDWVVSSFVTLGIILFIQKKNLVKYKYGIIISSIVGGAAICFL